MKTQYVLLSLLVVITLTTSMSGCLSSNPSSGQGNATGVPVYQPSVRTASVHTSEGNVSTYQTAGSAAQVAAFYKTEMVKLGYQASGSRQIGGSRTGPDVLLTFAKGTSTVRIAVATIKAQIGPLNLAQAGATTFVIAERGATP